MKKPILFYQYLRLFKIYQKLDMRLTKYFSSGRFRKFSKAKQNNLVKRLEKLHASVTNMERNLRLAGIAVGIITGIQLNSIEVVAQENFIPVGPEFRVNTTTLSNQTGSAIAIDSDGDFVITWTSYTGTASVSDVYAQRYNAAGVAQGSEFMVNTYTTNQQRYPDIAMNSDGDFVITWGSFLQDGSSFGVYAQRFDALGVAQGSEFKVNTYTTNDQQNSKIAMDNDGDFVIVWNSYKQINAGSKLDIFAQRYNASGIAQGSEFLVNTYTTDLQATNDIIFDDNGDFIITWNSQHQDYDYAGVYARRYNAVGIEQGNEFQVNTYTTSSQGGSRIGLDKSGGFVICWSSYQQDGSYDGVYAQRYNAAAVRQDGEFRVNTYTTKEQLATSMGMDAEGNFVILWQSLNQDGSKYGIYARAYNPSGVAIGNEFKVNSFTTDSQYYGVMSMDDDGDFVVTWTSYLQDGSSEGIYAQRYRHNHAPNGLSLSANSVDENVAANTQIGLFTTADQDVTDHFTYSLIAGIGSDDNASFVIVNDALQIVTSPDYETKSSYSILVRATDEGGLIFDKEFTIAVNDLPELPTSVTSTLSNAEINVYPNPAKGKYILILKVRLMYVSWICLVKWLKNWGLITNQ